MLYLMPNPQWVPLPECFPAALHRYGRTGGMILFLIIQRWTKSGKPPIISDHEFASTLNISRDQLRKVRLEMQADGIFPSIEPRKHSRARNYAIDFGALERAMATPIKPRNVRYYGRKGLIMGESDRKKGNAA